RVRGGTHGLRRTAVGRTDRSAGGGAARRQYGRVCGRPAAAETVLEPWARLDGGPAGGMDAFGRGTGGVAGRGGSAAAARRARALRPRRGLPRRAVSGEGSVRCGPLAALAGSHRARPR